MMNAQVSTNTTQVHPIHIQLQSLLAHFIWIAPGFRFWGVLAATVHAKIPLGARLGSTSFVLTFRLLAFWTCLHCTILTQIFSHSPYNVILVFFIDYGTVSRLPHSLLTRFYQLWNDHITNLPLKSIPGTYALNWEYHCLTTTHPP